MQVDPEASDRENESRKREGDAGKGQMDFKRRVRNRLSS